MRLTFTPLCESGASASPTERCWDISASSESHTVVPSTTDPGLESTPVAVSSASTRVVLPPPDGPMSTTFRMAAGLSAVGAAPAPWEVFALSAMTFPSSPGRFAGPEVLTHNSPIHHQAQDPPDMQQRLVAGRSQLDSLD